MRWKMEERSTEESLVITPNPGWKPRQERKKTLLESKRSKAPEEEETQPRPPAPLPFGKLDIFA